MVRHWCVAVVLCVVGGMMWTDVRGWERHPISCDFQGNECGWTNDENMTLSWTRERIVKLFKYDYFMALEMDDAEVNNTGRLSSPWLNGSDSQTCLLKFNRHIKTTHRACQLSVLLRTDTNLTSLWDTVDATGLFSEPSPNISVPCSENRFQIVFEGKKIKDESCGGSVDVDDIEFKVHQHKFSSPSPTPTPLQTTVVTTGRTDTPDINNKTSQNVTDHTDAYFAKDDDSGLSSGVIAAVIAVILVVIIFVSLIVIIFFVRRRAQKRGGTDHWTFNLFRTQKTQSPRPSRASAVYTNSCYVSCDDQVQANPGSNNSTRIHGGGHTASVHHYSTVDDTRYELSSPFSPNTKKQGGGSCSNNQDSYNVLSLKDPQDHPPPGPLREDFYNHLNEDGENPEQRSNPSASSSHHGQPGIQDDSKPSHLQDENSESPAKPIDDCSVSSKTGTTSNVAGAATTDYEIVGDDGAGNMIMSSLSASSGLMSTTGCE